MNSLLGYPSVGPSSLGSLGQTGESAIDKARFVWDVSQGKVAKDLESQKRQMSKFESELEAQRTALRGLQASRAKEYADERFSAASRAFFSAKADLNAAIADHNEVADKIRTYTLGFADPPSVGMAALPAIFGVAAWVAGFVVVFGTLVIAAAVAYNIATASAAGMPTIISESAQAIKAAGGFILNVSDALIKLAFTAGVAFVGYEVYQLYKSKKTSVPSSPPAALITPTVGAAA
jgi:hypothetical protein